jgi:hypothetical protein
MIFNFNHLLELHVKIKKQPETFVTLDGLAAVADWWVHLMTWRSLGFWKIFGESGGRRHGKERAS